MAGYWYLDHLENQWSDFYVDEIDDGQIPSDLVNLVIGGEGMLSRCDVTRKQLVCGQNG